MSNDVFQSPEAILWQAESAADSRTVGVTQKSEIGREKQVKHVIGRVSQSPQRKVGMCCAGWRPDLPVKRNPGFLILGSGTAVSSIGMVRSWTQGAYRSANSMRIPLGSRYFFRVNPVLPSAPTKNLERKPCVRPASSTQVTWTHSSSSRIDVKVQPLLSSEKVLREMQDRRCFSSFGCS